MESAQQTLFPNDRSEPRSSADVSGLIVDDLQVLEDLLDNGPSPSAPSADRIAAEHDMAGTLHSAKHTGDESSDDEAGRYVLESDEAAGPAATATGQGDGCGAATEQSEFMLGKKSLFVCLVFENPFHQGKRERRIVDENSFDAAEGVPFLQDEDLLRVPSSSSSDDDENNGDGKESDATTTIASLAAPLASAVGTVTASVQLIDEVMVDITSRADAERHGENVKMTAAAAGSGAKRREGSRKSLFNFGSEAANRDSATDGSVRRKRAPNNFQKIVEILLRLRARGLNFTPSAILVAVPPEQREARRLTDPNYFRGHALDEGALMTSPDGDELYVLVHASKQVLLRYAEEQHIVMTTNRYSFAGGGGLSYSAALEQHLAESVELYARKFPVRRRALNKDRSHAWGFLMDLPQKMRLTVRMLREAWRFGGCGIAVDEMRRNGVLLRNIFPLHNPEYLRAHNLTGWASLRALVSWRPLEQDNVALVNYFGESVALYFIWLRKYTLYLRSAALVGVIISILDLVGVSKSIVNAVFCVFIMFWSAYWMQKWAMTEAAFAAEFGQEVEQDQELVRDAFRPISERPISADDIYELKFAVPPTLQRNSDGSLTEKYFPPRMRVVLRAIVTYPAVLVVTSLLVWINVAITKWRFENVDSTVVTYSASVVTVIVGIVFGKLFDAGVPILNRIENNRTDREEENQRIIKSFFFHFFSNFFALFAIALWPVDGPDFRRLIELESQMIVICVAKPMVQNLQEWILPWVMTQLRRRVDVTGGYCAAFLSVLRCQTVHRDILPPGSFGGAAGEDGRRVWKEAQREAFESSADDYLEIVLQFGHLVMFASVFPWAAVAALLYNLIELRIDAAKILRYHQRPIARTACTIGAWSWIIGFLTALSVVTNSYMTCVLSPAPGKVGLSTDPASRYKYMLILQYAIGGGVLVMRLLFGSEPESVEKQRVKKALLRDRAILARITAELQRDGNEAAAATAAAEGKAKRE